MNEVYEYLKRCDTYYLATLEDGQPRVRPFGTVMLYDGSLCIQTGKSKNVSRQLHANPKFELCAFDGAVWLRAAGEAIPLDDIEAERKMLAEYPALQALYQPGDGNTEIFRLTKVTATFSSFTESDRVVRF